MDVMGIAAQSMALKQTQTLMAAQTSIMKQAMEAPGDLAVHLMDSMSADMTKAMEMSINPHIGGVIDLKV